jgi:FKBP12-rapamycin complex-associated protein
VQERWYEKLHEWDKALVEYEHQYDRHPDDVNFLLGRMRCLEALGEWYKSFIFYTDVE